MTNKTSAYNVASRSKRFLNLIIDAIFIFIACFIVDVILSSFNFPGGFIIFINFGVYFIYYFALELNFGKTIAKSITKTRVIPEDTDNALTSSVWQERIFGRTLCRFIPFEALSFLAGDPVVGWHDSISGTRVVDDETVTSNIIAENNKVTKNVQQEIEKLIKEEERYRENIKILDVNDEGEKKKRSEFIEKIVEIEQQIDNLKKTMNEGPKKN